MKVKAGFLSDFGQKLHSLIEEHIAKLGGEEFGEAPPYPDFDYAIDLLWELMAGLRQISWEREAQKDLSLTKSTVYKTLMNTLSAHITSTTFGNWLKKALDIYFHEDEALPVKQILQGLKKVIYGALEAEMLQHQVPRFIAIFKEKLLQAAKETKLAEKDAALVDKAISTITELLKDLPGSMLYNRVYLGVPVSLSFLLTKWEGDYRIALFYFVKEKCAEKFPGSKDAANFHYLWQAAEDLGLKAALLAEEAIDIEEVVEELVDRAKEAIKNSLSQEASKVAMEYREAGKKLLSYLESINKLVKKAQENWEEETRRAIKRVAQARGILGDLYEYLYRGGKFLLNKLPEMWMHRLNNLDTVLEEVEFSLQARLDMAEAGAYTTRQEAAAGFIEDLKEFEYEGKTVEDVLKETKRELREAFGGDAVAFAVPFRDIEKAFRGYWDRILKMLNNWLYDKVQAFQHFISKIYGELPPEKMEQWRRQLDEKINQFLLPSLLGLFYEDGVTKENVKALLKLVLETAMQEYFLEVPPRKKVVEALAYWKGLDTLVGNLTSLLQGISVGAEEEGYLVYYLSTRMEDYINIGTEMDANPNSCFWGRLGSQSIPSILVGLNVAVCYVFHIEDAETLKYAGGTPPEAGGIARFQPRVSLWDVGELAGRCLIIVDDEGKIGKSVSNSYITNHKYANVIWGYLHYILRNVFGDKRFSQTRWFYRTPNP